MRPNEGCPLLAAAPLLLLLAGISTTGSSPPARGLLEAECPLPSASVPLVRFQTFENGDGPLVIRPEPAKEGLAALQGIQAPLAVVGVAGPGGIGKSALLRDLAPHAPGSDPFGGGAGVAEEMGEVRMVVVPPCGSGIEGTSVVFLDSPGLHDKSMLYDSLVLASLGLASSVLVYGTPGLEGVERDSSERLSYAIDQALAKTFTYKALGQLDFNRFDLRPALVWACTGIDTEGAEGGVERVRGQLQQHVHNPDASPAAGLGSFVKPLVEVLAVPPAEPLAAAVRSLATPKVLGSVTVTGRALAGMLEEWCAAVRKDQRRREDAMASGLGESAYPPELPFSLEELEMRIANREAAGAAEAFVAYMAGRTRGVMSAEEVEALREEGEKAALLGQEQASVQAVVQNASMWWARGAKEGAWGAVEVGVAGLLQEHERRGVEEARGMANGTVPVPEGPLRAFVEGVTRAFLTAAEELRRADPVRVAAVSVELSEAVSKALVPVAHARAVAWLERRAEGCVGQKGYPAGKACDTDTLKLWEGAFAEATEGFHHDAVAGWAEDKKRREGVQAALSKHVTPLVEAQRRALEYRQKEGLALRVFEECVGALALPVWEDTLEQALEGCAQRAVRGCHGADRQRRVVCAVNETELEARFGELREANARAGEEGCREASAALLGAKGWGVGWGGADGDKGWKRLEALWEEVVWEFEGRCAGAAREVDAVQRLLGDARELLVRREEARMGRAALGKLIVKGLALGGLLLCLGALVCVGSDIEVPYGRYISAAAVLAEGYALWEAQWLADMCPQAAWGAVGGHGDRLHAAAIGVVWLDIVVLAVGGGLLLLWRWGWGIGQGIARVPSSYKAR